MPELQYDHRYLAGRCCDGLARDSGVLVHAHYRPSNQYGQAVCGARMGRLSAGWSEPVERAVTCPRCLKRMAQPRAPRLLPGAEQLLRDVAEGRPHLPLHEVDGDVKKQLAHHDLLTWHTASEAKLTSAGRAVLQLL